MREFYINLSNSKVYWFSISPANDDEIMKSNIYTDKNDMNIFTTKTKFPSIKSLLSSNVEVQFTIQNYYEIIECGHNTFKWYFCENDTFLLSWSIMENTIEDVELILSNASLSNSTDSELKSEIGDIPIFSLLHSYLKNLNSMIFSSVIVKAYTTIYRQTIRYISLNNIKFTLFPCKFDEDMTCEYFGCRKDLFIFRLENPECESCSNKLEKNTKNNPIGPYICLFCSITLKNSCRKCSNSPILIQIDKVKLKEYIV